MQPKEQAMIELTNEQSQALEEKTDQPARVRDPRTQQVFVLVRQDVYDLMQRWAGTFNRAGWDDPALDVYEAERDRP
jgi:hypothetical protein